MTDPSPITATSRGWAYRGCRVSRTPPWRGWPAFRIHLLLSSQTQRWGRHTPSYRVHGGCSTNHREAAKLHGLYAGEVGHSPILYSAFRCWDEKVLHRRIEIGSCPSRTMSLLRPWPWPASWTRGWRGCPYFTESSSTQPSDAEIRENLPRRLLQQLHQKPTGLHGLYAGEAG